MDWPNLVAFEQEMKKLWGEEEFWTPWNQYFSPVSQESGQNIKVEKKSISHRFCDGTFFSEFQGMFNYTIYIK